MNDSQAADISVVNQENRAIWNKNAAFWDEKMGEGNLFQRFLVGPASERLLELKPDELVLEIACGNGVCSRHLARLGARVVATDFAEKQLEHARARTVEHADRIEYRLMDATDENQLLALGRRRFDAAVCNMALMDMAAIEPLLSALSQLLKPNGRFVFTVMHPCFNTTGTILTAEEQDRDGELVTTFSVKVFKYLNLGTTKGLAIGGQPVPQYYFNRTLSVLFNTCFRAGFVLDGLSEPAFDEPVQTGRALNWTNFQEIPPALVARLILR